MCDDTVRGAVSLQVESGVIVVRADHWDRFVGGRVFFSLGLRVRYVIFSCKVAWIVCKPADLFDSIKGGFLVDCPISVLFYVDDHSVNKK